MIPNNINGHPGDSFDRKILLGQLETYYKTQDFEKIRLQLKRDLKEKKRLRNLLNGVDYTAEELVSHLSFMYDNLFTNLLIKRFRQAISELREEDGYSE